MPILTSRKRKFVPSRVKEVTWDSFRKQLNTLLRDSELTGEQVKDLTNLITIGKGILTQRPGTDNYYLASTNGKIRGLFGSKIGATSELLSVSDDGYLTKKNGTSNTRINGASYASGYKVRMTQLQSKVYIVQQNKPLTRYDGTTLLSYTTLASPSSLTATNLSGVTGTYTWSWRVAAFTDAGRTLASDPVVLGSLPEDLAETSVKISWSAPSAASGTIKGYELYGREQGAQTRLTGITPDSTSWIDDGTQLPSQIAFLPDYNETGGANAKYIIKSVGKVILANLANYPNRLMWSGADVNVGKFHFTKGGGYYDFDAGDGQEIRGIAETSENRIIVWKERSIYQVKLDYNSDYGIVEASVQKITDAEGCLSGDTIVNARNNHYFVGRSAGKNVAMFSLGYQPNILANVLRTAEISGAIRPNLDSVNKQRLDDMWAAVYDDRYWWFIPQGSNNMVAYCFDFERDGWSGSHTFPDNPTLGTIYYDDTGGEHFLYGDGDDGYITEISNGYSSDKGVPINWSFQTKKENFGAPFKLKTLLKAFYHLADISGGTVSVQILTEKEDGLTSTTTTESVDAPSTLAGWGSFPWGHGMLYGSSVQASTSTTNSSDVRKYMDINEPNVVSVAFKITSTSAKAKIVTLSLTAREQASLPPSWRSN